MKPGIHYGIPMADYLALPAVSGGLICTAAFDCMAQARAESWLNPARENDATDATDIGQVCHALLLEGHTDRLVVIDPAEYPAKNGNVPEGWTNPAIRAARDMAREEGKWPVLKARADDILAMNHAGQTYLAECKEAAVQRAFAKYGGDSEVTVIWEEDGVLCKARPDRLSKGGSLHTNYKTSPGSVHPDLWGRQQLVNGRQYVSAAWYNRGLRATGAPDPATIFLVQQTKAPYLCCMIGVLPDLLAMGDATCDKGLALWREALRTGEFEGYPGVVTYPEAPGWMLAQFEESQL